MFLCLTNSRVEAGSVVQPKPRCGLRCAPPEVSTLVSTFVSTTLVDTRRRERSVVELISTSGPAFLVVSIGKRSGLPRHAGVAQLVESELPKLKVAGSIPVARSSPNCNSCNSLESSDLAACGLRVVRSGARASSYASDGSSGCSLRNMVAWLCRKVMGAEL